MIKKLFIKLLNNDFNFNDTEQAYLEKFVNESIIIKTNNTYELNSKFRVGILKIENNFARLMDLDNEHKSIKLELDTLNGAYNDDFILVKRVFNPRSKVKAKILRVLEPKDNKLLVYKNKDELYTVKENIHLDHIKKSFSEYKHHDVFIMSSKNFEVIEYLGNLEDAKVDEAISLNLYQEEYRSDDIELEEAKMDDPKERVNLTHLPFCTIDPASAKDHDDAIYYSQEEHAIYVAIADVSYFVKKDSPLDKLAFKKSTSIYLPNKVLPMLPPSLSEEMCSLKEGVERYAYVFKVYLDENNQVKKSENFEAIILSHKKFSYGRIDRVLEGHLDQHSQIEKTIFNDLVALYKVTKDMRAKRLKNGYDFRTHEYRQRLNNKYELESITVESSTASHQLVEECMLLANIEASKKVNTVGIYRIHEEPSFKSITNLVDEVNSLGIKVKMGSSVHDTITSIQKQAQTTLFAAEVDELIIQSQTQAKYSSKNLGHFGLGFKSYSHFTSPIRRYSDLVLHRMLKTKEVPEAIDTICDHISKQERKVDLLVWDLEARKFARWAEKHIGEEFKAQVVDEERGIAKFYEVMPNLRVYIENFKGQKLFSKLKVTLKSADIVSKKIIASIKY